MELFSSSFQNLPFPKFRLAFLQVMLALDGNKERSNKMFGKTKFYFTTIVLLTMFLSFIVISSEAKVTCSFKGVSFWATEGGNKIEASGGTGVLKNEQGEIVAEGELGSIGGFLTVNAKKGATFTHTPSFESLQKENWPKEVIKDYSIVELTKVNQWSLRDSSFLFLLEVPMLNIPQLNVATDKSIARTSVVLFPEGTIKLWGYKVAIGKGGGNLKFKHGKIIDGSNAIAEGTDKKTLKFP